MCIRDRQHVAQLQAAGVEFRLVAAAQVEGQGATVQLVGAADQAAGLLHIGAGLFRGEGIAHGLAAQVVELRFEHVLRSDDQRQALNGCLLYTSGDR